MNRCSWAMLFAAAAVLAGCESKVVPAGVSGNVTLGGAPLDGSIRFIPAGSEKGGAKAEVSAGKYSIPVGNGLAFGDYRVEITSVPSTGAPAAADGSTAPAIELVPARYNTKSDLTASLKGGENKADFDLKPK